MNYEKYKNNVPYPQKDNFYRVTLYKKGDTLCHNATIKEATTKVFNTPMFQYNDLLHLCKAEGILVEKEDFTEDYKHAMQKHREGQQAAVALFKFDLEDEFGVVGNRNADKCFDLAWQHGHSAGYNEVYCYYSEFVELIK